MLPHVYKDHVDCLDLSDIAQKFVPQMNGEVPFLENFSNQQSTLICIFFHSWII